MLVNRTGKPREKPPKTAAQMRRILGDAIDDLRERFAKDKERYQEDICCLEEMIRQYRD
jgi:hypothetical protein